MLSRDRDAKVEPQGRKERQGGRRRQARAKKKAARAAEKAHPGPAAPDKTESADGCEGYGYLYVYAYGETLCAD